jgi:serine/tyrosine/threonine adenylyltransferase
MRGAARLGGTRSRASHGHAHAHANGHAHVDTFVSCRYSYKGQIQAVHWNVAQLASALLAAELIEQSAAQELVNAFPEQVLQRMHDGFNAKIGLPGAEEAPELQTELLQLMYDSKADFNNMFRALCGVSHEAEVAEVPPAVAAALGEELTPERSEAWREWFAKWRAAAVAGGVGDAERQAAQRAVNPAYIPRQHLLQHAINDAEKGDYKELEDLMAALKTPFEERPGAERFAEPPPADMIKPGISMLSCSS